MRFLACPDYISDRFRWSFFILSIVSDISGSTKRGLEPSDGHPGAARRGYQAATGDSQKDWPSLMKGTANPRDLCQRAARAKNPPFFG